jgi:HK97 gp10 family phage protein
VPKVTNNILPTAKKLLSALNTLRWQAARSHVAISRQLAPVDTGELRDGIKLVEAPEAGGFIAYKVIAAADHSLYVEFGTVKMDPQPYFMPGYESASAQLKATTRAIVEPMIAAGAMPGRIAV